MIFFLLILVCSYVFIAFDHIYIFILVQIILCHWFVYQHLVILFIFFCHLWNHLRPFILINWLQNHWLLLLFYVSSVILQSVLVPIFIGQEDEASLIIIFFLILVIIQIAHLLIFIALLANLFSSCLLLSLNLEEHSLKSFNGLINVLIFQIMILFIAEIELSLYCGLLIVLPQSLLILSI